MYRQPAYVSGQDSYRKKSPEQNLFLAIIFRACHDIAHYVQLKDHDKAKYKDAKDAFIWLQASQPSLQLGFYWAAEQALDEYELPGIMGAIAQLLEDYPLIKLPSSSCSFSTGKSEHIPPVHNTRKPLPPTFHRKKYGGVISERQLTLISTISAEEDT